MHLPGLNTCLPQRVDDGSATCFPECVYPHDLLWGTGELPEHTPLRSGLSRCLSKPHWFILPPTIRSFLLGVSRTSVEVDGVANHRRRCRMLRWLADSIRSGQLEMDVVPQ